MLLDFFDDIFLLHLALETAQRIFQRLTFLDNNFGHYVFTPNPVRIGILRHLSPGYPAAGCQTLWAPPLF